MDDVTGGFGSYDLSEICQEYRDQAEDEDKDEVLPEKVGGSKVTSPVRDQEHKPGPRTDQSFTIWNSSVHESVQGYIWVPAHFCGTP